MITSEKVNINLNVQVKQASSNYVDTLIKKIRQALVVLS